MIKSRRRNNISTRFLVCADLHYGENASGFHDYEKRLDKLVDWVKLEKAQYGLDFFVILGDLVYNTPELLPQVKTKLDQTGVTYYCAHGNHDHCTDSEWQALFGHPRNFSFTHNSLAVIMLNTASDTGQYITSDNAWLDEQLNHYAPLETINEIVLMMHIPQNRPRDIPYHGIVNDGFIQLVNGCSKIRFVYYGHSHMLNQIEKEDGCNYAWCGHIAAHGLNTHGYRIFEMSNDSVLEYANSTHKNISYQAQKRDELRLRKLTQ